MSVSGPKEHRWESGRRDGGTDVTWRSHGSLVNPSLGEHKQLGAGGTSELTRKRIHILAVGNVGNGDEWLMFPFDSRESLYFRATSHSSALFWAAQGTLPPRTTMPTLEYHCTDGCVCLLGNGLTIEVLPILGPNKTGFLLSKRKLFSQGGLQQMTVFAISGMRHHPATIGTLAGAQSARPLVGLGLCCPWPRGGPGGHRMFHLWRCGLILELMHFNSDLLDLWHICECLNKSWAPEATARVWSTRWAPMTTLWTPGQVLIIYSNNRAFTLTRSYFVSETSLL